MNTRAYLARLAADHEAYDARMIADAQQPRHVLPAGAHHSHDCRCDDCFGLKPRQRMARKMRDQ